MCVHTYTYMYIQISIYLSIYICIYTTPTTDSTTSRQGNNPPKNSQRTRIEHFCKKDTQVAKKQKKRCTVEVTREYK
jgi:hypothetical protein